MVVFRQHLLEYCPARSLLGAAPWSQTKCTPNGWVRSEYSNMTHYSAAPNDISDIIQMFVFRKHSPVVLAYQLPAWCCSLELTYIDGIWLGKISVL